jgi:proteasome activator subunit 4
MTELHDNTELEGYSAAVLYVLSAVTAPSEFRAQVLNAFITAIQSASVRVLRGCMK